MDLKPFIATKVNPGDPVTAQAWNDIVDGTDGVYKFLQATLHLVKVRITTSNLDPAAVRVTATRAAGTPYEAVRPVPPDTTHVLAGLEAGAYTLVAQAPGYTPATQTLTIADAGETSLEMTLSPVGAFMPDLFGMRLADALGALAAAQIPVTRLLDFTARELAAQTVGEGDDADAPVLAQSPAAGATVAAGGGAQLVVATPVTVEPAIEVPSLAGLSQFEAQKALEAIGLVLGKVEIRQSPLLTL
jgi:PASTA domain-containing protein